jgi:alpha-galactosidase
MRDGMTACRCSEAPAGEQFSKRSGDVTHVDRLALTLVRRLALTVAIATGLFVLVVTRAPALDNGLARTPPMGWNSWYTARCAVTQGVVLRNAHALVDTGMADLGYRYVNVDGCWEALERDGDGNLTADPGRFPDGMAALGRAIHELGLKYGIYTSAGPTICSHEHPGSAGHLRQDMRTFASWKVDYVKVDWCNVPAKSDPREVYARVARAAAKAGRTMLVTVSTPGVRKPWEWAAAYGNTWRISADANGKWKGVMASLDVDAPLYPYAGPGGWNDPDMLQVGNRVLTRNEERAHLSLWSMLAAPLLEGYDLRSMAPESLAVLLNRDVIAVDQDRLGRQGRRFRRADGLELWVRRLRDRATAVLALNRTGKSRPAEVRLDDVPGLPDADGYEARELWTGATTEPGRHGRLRAEVAKHGVAMWRLRPRSTSSAR